jgi:hypothetical protein
MAAHFNAQGVPARSVHSASNNRQEALDQLRKGRIKVVFSVDIFNEGLDVKDIDTVMFLRPTESPTVFLQQLGRGLRISPGKDHLKVLDFIGNFKKVTLIPYLLSGKNRGELLEGRIDLKAIREDAFYPDGCRIDFDFEVVDLFEKYLKEKASLSDLVREEFNRVQEDLGRTPGRVDLLTNLDEGIYALLKRQRKLNPFKDYLKYHSPGSRLIGTIAHDFIKMIENTSMSKLYKLPVLLAFYNDGSPRLTIDEEDIYQAFREFYSNGQNALDMKQHKKTRRFRSWEKEDFLKLAFENPIHFLSKTHGDFFEIKGRTFSLTEGLRKYLDSMSFKSEFIDAIEFRRIEFLRERLEKKEMSDRK